MFDEGYAGSVYTCVHLTRVHTYDLHTSHVRLTHGFPTPRVRTVPLLCVLVMYCTHWLLYYCLCVPSYALLLCTLVRARYVRADCTIVHAYASTNCCAVTFRFVRTGANTHAGGGGCFCLVSTGFVSFLSVPCAFACVRMRACACVWGRCWVVGVFCTTMTMTSRHFCLKQRPALAMTVAAAAVGLVWRGWGGCWGWNCSRGLGRGYRWGGC